MKIIKVPGVNGLGHTEGTLNSPNLLTENLENSEIVLDKSNVEEQERKIYEESLNFLKTKEKILFIGGDHSISFPIGKAFLKTYNDPCLIVFDAHADLMKPMNPATHEEWLRALIESGFPKENITIIGVRNLDKKEKEYINKNKIKIININEIDNLINSTKDKDIYLSFDIDVFDPSLVKATGYPEKNGLKEEIFPILEKLSNLSNLKCIDLVEVNLDKEGIEETLEIAKKVINIFKQQQ